MNRHGKHIIEQLFFLVRNNNTFTRIKYLSKSKFCLTSDLLNSKWYKKQEPIESSIFLCIQCYQKSATRRWPTNCFTLSSPPLAADNVLSSHIWPISHSNLYVCCFFFFNQSGYRSKAKHLKPLKTCQCVHTAFVVICCLPVSFPQATVPGPINEPNSVVILVSQTRRELSINLMINIHIITIHLHFTD